MKIEELCVDVYREECNRASQKELELKDVVMIEVKLSEELLEKLEAYNFSECDTLVGAMRSPRQFGICLKCKFYHIPAFYIEEYPIPKYIALYQSQKMFGEEMSGVKYYGEVKKYTPMRRSKIREIPKDSNEIYYKFKVKCWNRLDMTVSSGEIGFVRLFTNFFLLENVDDISALTLADAYEFRLYKLLKLANNIIKSGSCGSYFSIDGFDVIFTNQIIYLCANGKIKERYYRSSLEEAPCKLLRKLKKDIAILLNDPDENKEKKDEI